MSRSGSWEARLSPAMRDIVRAARRAGWEVGSTAKSHIRFTAPSGQTVIASGSGRNLNQHLDRTRKRLTACGLDLDGGRHD